MSTEVWFRNPNAYIRELVEMGQSRVIWDRGLLVKKGIDPIKHADLYFGTGMPYRVLACGPQGTAEYRPGDTWEKPSAVYPTWEYGEDGAILLDMIENPAGADRDACSDKSVDGNERPVWGQEHRIVITSVPPANQGPSRSFLTWLKEIQEDYPDCIIHLHGAWSYRVAFGLKFGAADVDPRYSAQKGKVALPSGKEELYERVQAHPQWVTNLGFQPVDLAVPRNRCMYNIKSALWAGDNYAGLVNFNSRKSSRPVDIKSPEKDFKAPTTVSPIIGAIKPIAGDKMLCDSCSLQDKCKSFRVGAVCSLPDAEPVHLSKLFKTRDSDVIIDGLGTLMAAGANRLEHGMQQEQAWGDLDPQVTKMMNQLFQQGIALAKLVDPNLRGGVKVNVGVGAGGHAAVQVNAGSEKELVAGIMRSLQAQGIPREAITTDMVTNLLEAMGKGGVPQQQAIEGVVVANREEAS